MEFNNTGKAKSIVLMSGGIDSTACIHYMLKQGYDVNGLYIDYGNISSSQEILAAKKIAELYNISFQICKLINGSSFETGEIVGRNAFFIFTALLQNDINASFISGGMHGGTSYYDCSEAFVSRINALVQEYTNGKTSLLFPFIKWTKKDIYDYSLKENIPLNLTYSCESGLEKPCGKCSTCKDIGELKHVSCK